MLIAALCAAVAFVSCSGIFGGETSGAQSGQSAVSAVSGAQTETSKEEPSPLFEHVVTEECSFADETARAAAEHIDPAINAAIDVLNEYRDRPELKVKPYDAADYKNGYETLTELQKKLYAVIEPAVARYGQYSFSEKDLENNEGSTNGYGDIIDAAYAVYNDHPEYTMYFSDHSTADSHYPRYFMPNDYKHASDDINAVSEAVDFYRAVFARVVECMPQGISDYRKMLYFAAVICNSCTYDYDYATLTDPFPAYDALVGGYAVCQGYTQAFRLLCHAAGLSCKSIMGRTESTKEDKSETHIWNAVETVDGVYYVDVTWTDNNMERRNVTFTFDYFLMDEETLEFEGYLPDFDKIS